MTNKHVVKHRTYVLFPLVHWPIQEPKLEVLDIHKAYVGKYAHQILPKKWYYIPPFQVHEWVDWLVDNHSVLARVIPVQI